MNDSQNLKNALAFVGLASEELESIRKDCHEKMRLDLIQRIDWVMLRLAYAIGSINNERAGV